MNLRHRKDPWKNITTGVCLAIMVAFAVAKISADVDPGPYWTALLGGALGIGVVAGNTRQDGRRDSERDGSDR